MPDPQGFLKYAREDESKRPVAERVKDWKDVTVKTSVAKARQQATRCMDCGVPFCQSAQGCPVENLIPDWNDLIHQGRWKQALALLHSTNNFPEFTGKLCPAPCESACVLGLTGLPGLAGFEEAPVSIRNIELAIIERGFDEDWVTPEIAPALTGKKVAIVGSGPAGLAAAQQLARRGHSVTVFEKADRLGGLLRYGIPDFKIEKPWIDRRLKQMEAEGVSFVIGAEIGKSVEPERLRKDFDAVCLTLGAETPRDLNIPGRELNGVHFALEYLSDQNRRVSGILSDEQGIHARGKKVVIIGGGDTGSDCLGTALRQGASEVHQFEIMPTPPRERHSSTPWPLWSMKLRTSHAHEEGGKRHWSVSTVELLGKHGQVSGLHGIEVKREGRDFLPVPGTDFEMGADLVLLAMGFSGVERKDWLTRLGIVLTPAGGISVDDQFMTSIPGVFSAGDAHRGASLIVWAISEGRKMAVSVDRFLVHMIHLLPDKGDFRRHCQAEHVSKP